MWITSVCSGVFQESSDVFSHHLCGFAKNSLSVFLSCFLTKTSKNAQNKISLFEKQNYRRY